MKKEENLKEQEFNEKVEELKVEELKENENIAENENQSEEVKLIDELNKKIEELKAEVEELRQLYLRKHAEFQNYAKRKESEYDELKKYASEKVIGKFLPNLDNLERALSTAEVSQDFKALHDGIVMIVNSLKEMMKSEGVEEIKTDGQFDPLYHHAVMVEESEEHEDNEISKVLQKGYILNGKVVRPAMVTVYKKINNIDNKE